MDCNGVRDYFHGHTEPLQAQCGPVEKVKLQFCPSLYDLQTGRYRNFAQGKIYEAERVGTGTIKVVDETGVTHVFDDDPFLPEIKLSHEGTAPTNFKFVFEDLTTKEQQARKLATLESELGEGKLPRLPDVMSFNKSIDECVSGISKVFPGYNDRLTVLKEIRQYIRMPVDFINGVLCVNKASTVFSAFQVEVAIEALRPLAGRNAEKVVGRLIARKLRKVFN